VILSSTESEPPWVVTVIVPDPFAVPTPLSLKIRAAAVGVEEGVVTAEVGDGGGPEPVPELPHAAAATTIAIKATHRFIPGNRLHLCTRALPVKVT
jgi:hypothetical protein